MGVSAEQSPRRRHGVGHVFRKLTGGGKKNPPVAKKLVHFDTVATEVSYPGPEEQDRALYYPDKTEKQTLMEFRKQIMTEYVKGSAHFKYCVEELYTAARKDYTEQDLSSNTEPTTRKTG